VPAQRTFQIREDVTTRKRRATLLRCASRLLCCLVGWMVLPSTASSQQVQLTVGALKSVYLIRYGQSYGTGFILAADEKVYLITAAHVVEGMKSGEKIGVRTGWDKWNDFVVIRIPVPNKVDIAIFATDRPISDLGMAIEAGSMQGLASNPDVYFLGFPYAGGRTLNGRTYSLTSTYRENGVTYPVALVKHGIISGVDIRDPDSRILFIDAMNNPGFSGSPVVYWDQQSKRPKVLGVVSARIPDELMVPVGVQPPPAWDNSGITIASSIDGALEAIRHHGVGAVK
jgi:S1-C subfamily serine protease